MLSLFPCPAPTRFFSGYEEVQRATDLYMGLGQGFFIYQERVPGNQARTPSDPCFVLSSEVSTQTGMGFVDPGRTLLTQGK